MIRVQLNIRIEQAEDSGDDDDYPIANPFVDFPLLHDQVNRLFNETAAFRNQAEESALTTWAPSVDI